MVEYAMLQGGSFSLALPFELSSVAWVIVGAVVLLVVWEFATFLAYMAGLADRRRPWN